MRHNRKIIARSFKNREAVYLSSSKSAGWSVAILIEILWFGMNPYKRRHDSQHNDTQNNDIQH
jgi:hypothetical protein